MNWVKSIHRVSRLPSETCGNGGERPGSWGWLNGPHPGYPHTHTPWYAVRGPLPRVPTILKGPPDALRWHRPAIRADMTSPDPCPFCSLRGDAILAESSHCVAIRDVYPVAAGHALVLPRRHVASVFQLDPDEWTDLWALVRHVREMLGDEGAAPAANVGVNDGGAAGQTVPHAHVHIIPRTPGDVADPRGGIRWVIPEKARYWSDEMDEGRP